MTMLRRIKLKWLALTSVLVLAAFLVPVSMHGQPLATAIYVALQSGFSQSTLRVNITATPNRTELGCEADRLGGTTVNGIRIFGAVTGTGPSIAGIPCTGGDTNRTLNLLGAGSGGVTFANGIDSTISASFFLSALERCRADAASSTVQNSLVPVRAASGDWSIQRTAAGAETINIHCDLTLAPILRATASKGARIDSFSIAQQITVAALTSNVFNAFAQTVYANNVADAVTNCCGTITITMPTATQANPYLTAATIGTPTFQNTAGAAYGLDWTVVLQGTGVYSLKGVLVNATLAPY